MNHNSRPFQEIEVKVRIDQADLPTVRERLQALGLSSLGPAENEQNELYDFPDGRLTAEGCALRLRRVANAAWLTFKGPQVPHPTLKIREEFECPVGDVDNIARILGRLGLQVIFRYSKKRERLRAMEPADLEVALDQTPIGCFIELEGSPEAIRHVADRMGWPEESFITRSYVELYQERGL